ncbi:long-chain fatty acid transport protein [Parabacteroides sp. PFB2-12]|uniref:OmpP1/FadL family transporter n=1 Tax=unclassified Parabacteroides TaxID=2649774 RepID=UPI00247585CB|nr:MULTISPECIES: outer membrane protein transport protein [unclassified Parabacteroides]MDH6343235.1 long-chain fatty acid transport protein [Parabacteroides sp. PM6-13]MDH6390251.1 long-chain fatty acid transport protein [Parabacteroides sp. PFB2-12]
MKKIMLLVSLCVLPFTYAAAEGYQVNSLSAKQSGMGHVGAAMKLGAESMHFNPAGLGFLDKTLDLSAGVSGVFSSAKYTQGSYTHEADNDPSTPLYFYGAFKIYDFLSAGVSLTTPYGSAMNWGKNWQGAGLIQDIALKSYSIQPTLSWKITDRLSIGAGAMIMFGDFELSRALVTSGDLGLLAMQNPALQPLADKYKDITPVAVTLGGNAGVKVGYNLGAMFDITDQWTVGVSYRSKVDMAVGEGTAQVQYANETELKPILGAGIPALDQGTFEAALPLPSNLNVGVTYKPNARLLLSGEVQFVGWEAYDELNVEFTQGAIKGYNINAKKDYQNTRIYRLGGQYAATDRFDLRLGAYYDESPVKDDYLNPETPSMDKLGVTAGMSFRPLQSLSIDLGLAYVTGFGRDGSYPMPNKLDPNNTFSGHYEVSAFTLSLGVGYSF